MKFLKGLHTDSNPVDQPEGTYRFAKNLVNNSITLAKENEEGFTLELTLGDLGGAGLTSIIGIIPVGSSYVVFLTDDTECAIKLVTNATVTTIYSDPLLNFKKSNPIKGEYRVNVFGDRIIAWQDALNPDRLLNIDDLTGVSSVEDMAIDQNYANPQLSVSLVDTGGSLPSGAYVFITKNKGSDGSETDWFVHDRVIYVNDDSRSLSFNDCDGCIAGTITNKAIQTTFTNGDLRYESLIIGILQTVSGVTRAFKVIEKINGVSVSHLLTGNEQTTELSLDEVLTPPARYKFSKAMTQVAGQLVRANLTGEAIPDFQKYVNGIRLDYSAATIAAISNNGSHKDAIPPTFVPGEVYAFYIGLNLKKGGWIFYHIPGRPAAGTSPTDSDLDSVTAEGLTYLRYQVENTSNKVGATTNMGYWENQNETYPDHASFDGTPVGNENLRGLKVRHHRMPSLDYLVTNIITGGTIGITELIRLDVDVNNVIIPADIQTQINGWKIFYAKKTVGDSIVMGSDLLQFGCSEQDNTTVRSTTGGNWGINAEQAGSDDWRDSFMEKDTLRCHSLDLSYDRSRAVPTYADFFYTLNRADVNTQFTGFRSIGGMLTRNGEDRGQVAGGVVDFTVPTSTTRTGAAVRKRLDNFKHLPAGAIDGKFRSNNSESVFVCDINNPSTSFDDIIPDQLLINSPNQSPDTRLIQPNGIENVKYYHLHRLISSAHTSFFQQDLIPLTGFSPPATTVLSGCQGGDGFICFMSYLALAPKHPNNFVDKEGVRVWKAYIGYAKNNWNFRHEMPGVIGSKYYGKTDPRSLFTPFADNLDGSYVSLVSSLEEQNQLNYNQDYSKQNDFISPVIFSPDIINETEFSTLVVWSTVQAEDSDDMSWRTFPSGNRYTMPRHRGVITNIQGVRNRDLLIHHEHSLFKTVTDSSLSANGEDIFLKSNSFFAVTPIEVLSTEEGYAGCQHKFGARLTKSGYVFPDDSQGKIFIFDGDKLQEISANGNRRFFRDNMKLGSTDNPFTSNGYTVGYDERYNRIIMSKKGPTSFTVSFDPQTEQWISYHDYTPDHMFRLTSDILYSVKGMGIYRHQDGARGTFYNGTIFPTIFDTALSSKERQLFTGVNWRTECYDTSGVLQYDTTFSHVTPMTVEQCGGRIAVVRPNDVFDVYDANTRIIHGTWYFNQLRDIALSPGFRLGFANNYDLDPTKLDSNQDWYENRKIVDNFLICRFEFPNTLNRLLAIYDIDITYRNGTR